MKKLVVLIPAFVIFAAFSVADVNRFQQTPEGLVINWHEDTRLNWSDFRALRKPGKGFAVASSACGFGYEGMIRGDEVLVNVYVRFYCDESWRHQGYMLPEVLQHEQLHFDICELYGRIFYKHVLFLRESGSLNERTLKKTLNNLIAEYDRMQDRYDRETGHSTNLLKQKEWNEKIRIALRKHQQYANYREM